MEGRKEERVKVLLMEIWGGTGGVVREETAAWGRDVIAGGLWVDGPSGNLHGRLKVDGVRVPP